ncbi:helix-turn-helix transcriptional regulator [Roseococcus sp. DSY-14]|uniref:helix-turn-helix transcriptional regulator n=1 Tax=Roseococcus sp. DSY-14 TaxID=3369650 RepID=UPI00387AA861
MRDGLLDHGPPAPGLPAVRFDVAALPEAQRFDAWRERQGGLSELEVPPASRRRFQARTALWSLGPLVVSATACSGAGFRRSPAHVRRDGLDHWMIRLLTRGRSLSRYPAEELHALPMQPFLTTLATPWEARWDDGEWISLFIPRDAFPVLSQGLAALGDGPLRGAGAGLLADWLLLLRGRLETGAAEEAPHLAEAAVAMISACLLVGAAPDGAQPTQGRMEQARLLMRRHHGEATFTPARLAAMMGMSRTALYKLFEPQGGVTRALQRLRLSLAHATLCDPAHAGTGIGALAERHGFFDHTAFTRAFRAEYGYTPREARMAAGAGLRLVRPATGAPAGATLAAALAGRR